MENEDPVPVVFREMNRLTRGILELVVLELRRLRLPSDMGPSDQSFLVAAARTHAFNKLGGGAPPDAVHPGTLSPMTRRLLDGISDERLEQIFYVSSSLKVQEDTLREQARLGDSLRAKFFRWKDEVFTLMSGEALVALGKDQVTYRCVLAVKEATDALCERADDQAAFERGVSSLREAFKHLVGAGLQRDCVLPAAEEASDAVRRMGNERLLRELLIAFGGQEETRVYPTRDEFLRIKALRSEVLRRLDERDELASRASGGASVEVRFGEPDSN